jgi:hypothetical protein
MKPRSKLSRILSDVAGEYSVAGELSRRGYVASLTLRNTRGIDILASNTDATKSVGIQVKTNQGEKRDWLLTESAETDTAENLFYVLVRLNGLGAPEYYIVPRAVVAKYVRAEHSEWLSTPGRGGKAHKENPMRTFRDRTHQYRDRWDLLGLGSNGDVSIGGGDSSNHAVHRPGARVARSGR